LDAAHYSPELLAGHDLPGWITRDKRFENYFLTEMTTPMKMRLLR
jgi:hypothetical protein